MNDFECKIDILRGMAEYAARLVENIFSIKLKKSGTENVSWRYNKNDLDVYIFLDVSLGFDNFNDVLLEKVVKLIRLLKEKEKVVLVEKKKNKIIKLKQEIKRLERELSEK